MATQKKSKAQKSDETALQQVRLSVEPGSKLKISVDVGETITNGKVPVAIQIERVAEEELQSKKAEETDTSRPVDMPVATGFNVRAGLGILKNRLKTLDLSTWLFICAVGVYLATRLIGLTRFPIYFFTDEAIQTQSIVNLIKNGYQDATHVWLPTYFRNGDYYNLSLSVYLQWLPYILFGKSAFLTRAVSVFVTLIAAISVGVILRDIFKMKYWWTGTLLLSITPAWFLHSRTTFETAEFVALYAGTLCAYLLYRYKSPRYLLLTIFLGALAFYTYSPGQLIIPLTAIGLFFSDWRYHTGNRRIVLIGLLLGAILALPYIRATLNNPNASFTQLHTLWSYWYDKIPLSEKITRYISEFGIGLNPWYWYVPNDRDLPRHLMKDYGNIMIATLPFALVGMAYVLRNLRSSSPRTILIALLISPAAAALVQTSITRVLVFVIPAAILTAIGFEQIFQWCEAPRKHLLELGEGPGPNPIRIGGALLILLLGIPIAFVSTQQINRVAISGLAILLALQTSGVMENLARSISHAYISENQKHWHLSQTVLALLAFIVLSGANISMLNDALTNGPLWFRDYGLGGMQYGGFQIFDIIKQYLSNHPNAKIIFSPDWANGTDVVANFFLGDPLPIQVGSVRGHITQKLPLDNNTLFIMIPDEFDLVKESNKFKDPDVETIVPYPDGSPGFYFVHLRYVDNIDEIFAAEKAERQVLQESIITLDGQDVKLRFSYLDSEFQAESMALVFDNDPFTVAKTFEANPFVIEMTFPKSRNISGFSIIIGSAKVQITLKCFPTPDAQPTVYVFDGQGTDKQPELSFDLPDPIQVQVLQIEVLDPLSSEPAKIHIWELKLR